MKELKSKVILIGDASVGKTSLILRYFERKFTSEIQSTIGTNFFTKIFPEEPTPDRKVLHKMDVWDTCGQERFMAIASVFYKNANAVVFVVDASNRKTLEKAEEYLKEVKSNQTTPQFILLCVNKIDLLPAFKEGQPVTSEVLASCPFFDDIESFAKSNKFDGVLWSSAKESLNVDKIFEILDEAVVTKKIQLDAPCIKSKKKFVQSITRDNNPMRNSSSGGCCS